MNLHVSHGVTFMMNYVWSRSIDDDGTFRSGYAIPAAFSNSGRSFGPDAIERTVSVINQPHHFVFTGVEHLPFGSGKFGGSHAWERALFGGYQFSQIVQTFSGSPLPILASSCQTNPAQIVCEPTLNASFSGSARLTKHWSGLGPNIVPSAGSATVAPTGPVHHSGPRKHCVHAGIHLRQCAPYCPARTDRTGSLRYGYQFASQLPVALRGNKAKPPG